jgi:CBS domain-containing protein
MSRPIGTPLTANALASAAGASTRQTVFGSLADASTPLAETMTRDVRYVRPAMRAHAVAHHLRQHGEHEAPVVDELGRPIGVVTLADLDDSPAARVGDVMTPVVDRLPSSATIVAAAARITEHRAERLYVVTSDGVLAGCFSWLDLARWVLRETGHASEAAEGAPTKLVPRFVRDAMHPCAAIITAGETVAEARARFDAAELPYLPVCREGRLVGVLAAADVDALAPVFAEGAAGCLDYLFVGDVMRSPPLALRADTPLPRARRVLESTDIGCAIVEDEGRVVGVLLPEDLALDHEPDAAPDEGAQRRMHLV